MSKHPVIIAYAASAIDRLMTRADEAIDYFKQGVFQHQVPYSVGIIDLEEGIRLIATVIDDADKIKNDEAVQLLVLSFEDGPLFAVRRMDQGKHTFISTITK